MYKHILLEVYCGLNLDNNESTNIIADCCSSSKFIPSYNCLYNKCPNAIFTSCENAMCYIGKESIAEEIVLWGGEMEICSNINTDAIELWKNISIKKINEAYEEYIRHLTKIRENQTNTD